jgi:hypothetical protein
MVEVGGEYQGTLTGHLLQLLNIGVPHISFTSERESQDVSCVLEGV